MPVTQNLEPISEATPGKFHTRNSSITQTSSSRALDRILMGMKQNPTMDKKSLHHLRLKPWVKESLQNLMK
jgi:hypothetical protein